MLHAAIACASDAVRVLIGWAWSGGLPSGSEGGEPMVPVLSLLIPIVVSAVFVFIASSIIHMATPFHKNDIRKFPDEEAVRKALRPLNLPPGDYGVPKPGSMKEMG